ncbi:hypothetical protein DdX_17432 [Ditylenchus destructor]|uniref:Uncharacterized protein n=1 Tax=Ditylenchus destructor TaxID=166010 RepID=A0AAD4MNL9_9BILA|nr:hypothetical protein DdX_17432 [Ditylenchus destructor]
MKKNTAKAVNILRTLQMMQGEMSLFRFFEDCLYERKGRALPWIAQEGISRAKFMVMTSNLAIARCLLERSRNPIYGALDPTRRSPKVGTLFFDKE